MPKLCPGPLQRWWKTSQIIGIIMLLADILKRVCFRWKEPKVDNNMIQQRTASNSLWNVRLIVLSHISSHWEPVLLRLTWQPTEVLSLLLFSSCISSDFGHILHKFVDTTEEDSLQIEENYSLFKDIKKKVIHICWKFQKSCQVSLTIWGSMTSNLSIKLRNIWIPFPCCCEG